MPPFDLERQTQEIVEFLQPLKKESERSAVVLGAERVNVEVEELLKAFLLPSRNSKDKLFENDGALATFSRKVEMAYRLGLIDLELKRALDLVRSLRNDFAHAVIVENLSEEKHANRVSSLVKIIAAYGEVHKPFLSLFAHCPKQCQEYLSCIMAILVRLQDVRGQLEQRLTLPAGLTLILGDDLSL